MPCYNSTIGGIVGYLSEWQYCRVRLVGVVTSEDVCHVITVHGAKSFHKITHKKAVRLRVAGVGSVRTGKRFGVYSLPNTVDYTTG